MTIQNASLTLRVLARLLSYPGAELHAHLAAMREVLHNERAVGVARLVELDALIDSLIQADAMDSEAAYVELFDRGRSTSLHLFEHVHGDSRDRGPAMIDLAQTYEKAGLYLAPDELPDYLPAVLEFVSTQPPKEARAFLAEMAHIFNTLFGALQQRQSAYASVLGALLELAGEKAQPVKQAPEEALDASWVEPLAFDGCSSQGQAKPGQPQPIHIVRAEPGRSMPKTSSGQGASI
ncbi:MAG: nitrate reductase molybdenum cofactor assembly chaperone [Rhodoferax sp.]|nr:nitrate reductase molybdenum cofactor assembly chaperone [Rhodoferax sp.]